MISSWMLGGNCLMSLGVKCLNFQIFMSRTYFQQDIRGTLFSRTKYIQKSNLDRDCGNGRCNFWILFVSWREHCLNHSRSKAEITGPVCICVSVSVALFLSFCLSVCLSLSFSVSFSLCLYVCLSRFTSIQLKENVHRPFLCIWDK